MMRVVRSNVSAGAVEREGPGGLVRFSHGLIRIRRGRRMVGGTVAAVVIVGGVGGGMLLSQPQTLDSKTTCLYTGSSVSALTDFATLTGQQVNCVLLYNDGSTTWSEWVKPWFTEPSTSDSDWLRWLHADPSTRRVVLSQELVPDDVPANWRELGAAGAYDGYARQLAANLVAAGMGNAVIRLGHEMNGTWYHDGLGNDPAEYGDWSAYWARIVTAMRSVPGAHFLFDWNVNAGYRNIPLASYYPGNSVVDIIGVDVYDSGMPGNPGNPATRWSSLYHEPGGLADIVSFAREHGKPLSFPEWGLVNATSGGLGDDPRYVTGIADLIKDNDVVYQAYFDPAADDILPLQDAPQSRRLWVQYFGPNGIIQGSSWLSRQ